MLYKGNVSLKDIDVEWLKSAVDPSNVPEFVRNKGFVLDRNKIRLRFNITKRCNLRCSYCSAGNQNSTLPDMSESLATETITNLHSLAMQKGIKEFEITFSGGEPTLCIDFMLRIGQLARRELEKTGIKVILKLLTNGLFSQRRIKSLLNILNGIQVSWDGFSVESPRYGNDLNLAKKVWDNIGFLIEQKMPPSILSVISESNYLHLRQIVDDLCAYGL